MKQKMKCWMIILKQVFRKQNEVLDDNVKIGLQETEYEVLDDNIKIGLQETENEVLDDNIKIGLQETEYEVLDISLLLQNNIKLQEFSYTPSRQPC